MARVISKLGIGSRTQAAEWVRLKRVRVNGVLVSDPEFPVRHGVDRVSVDGVEQAGAVERLVIMLNKPRGLVSTVHDEQGRDTVYSCLSGSGLPWLAPAGRLDKASEGLLLFSNDPAWNAAVTDPERGPPKTYHVQINRLPDAALLQGLVQGVTADDEYLSAAAARLLRQGGKNAWLEIELHEGRNRQIRRLLSAFDTEVLRLIRVGIGALQLGDLPNGQWRRLSDAEVQALAARR
ncbi:MAG: rRNA synthase [Gammaproteobacteria bacterium]|nr:rRNA synthase [Gammaproteobacteria bacterium]